MKEIPTEDIYNSYWKEIVENNDGSINLEQLKKELADFYTMIYNIPKIFCHITGGMVSKHLTDPDTICNLADEFYRKSFDESERIKENYTIPQGASVEISINQDNQKPGGEIFVTYKKHPINLVVEYKAVDAIEYSDDESF